MGAKISRTETASMKQPATSKITHTAKTNTSGLVMEEVKLRARVWGMPARVMTQPKAWVAASIWQARAISI